MVFSTTDVKRTFQKKGPNKSVHRVKALEKYSTELIQGDPNVTQSSEVIQFFQPKAHDLEPDFAKNRYVFFKRLRLIGCSQNLLQNLLLCSMG